MQFTSKFILIALALACGGTAVSAAPVTREFSLAARSADTADDMELFVRGHPIKPQDVFKVSPFRVAFLKNLYFV